MIAAKIFAVPTGVVGCVIRYAYDSGGGLVGIGNEAVPDRAAQSTVALAHHQRVAQPIAYVTKLGAAVAKENAIAVKRRVLEFEGAEHANVVALGDRKQRITTVHVFL